MANYNNTLANNNQQMTETQTAFENALVKAAIDLMVEHIPYMVNAALISTKMCFSISDEKKAEIEKLMAAIFMGEETSSVSFISTGVDSKLEVELKNEAVRTIRVYAPYMVRKAAIETGVAQMSNEEEEEIANAFAAAAIAAM